MAAPPYILAKTMTEAHEFARNELGLAKGHYRLVTSPSSISGRRGTDLYLLPGWETRYDRFAMRSALKYTRLNKIDVTELRQSGVQDDLEPVGEQLVLVADDEAESFVLDGLDMINEGGPAPAEEPVRRTRRRRCPECDELIEPDDVEQHASKHNFLPGT